MSNSVRVILYLIVIGCLVTFSVLTVKHYRVMDAKVSTSEIDDRLPGVEGETEAEQGSNMGRVMTYGALSFFSLVALALLISRDLSKAVGTQAEKFFFSDDGEGLRDPLYEQAEQAWADGKFLEAIQLMRDFLKENPRELHAAIRIAEIYEKDLGNFLAAALEYEELLKFKLPPERWGWAAIHLANLYTGRLGRSEQAVELLHRIVNEYGQTAAAKKARKRLSIEEPSESADAEDPDDSDPNLPPGFSRLKK